MAFNPTKCEFIHVSHEKHPRICDYYIQDHPIKAATHVKYLGVTIDEHSSFNEHVNRIAHKTNTVKTILKRNIKSCPLQVKENCYKIMVRPIMKYACTVWSPYTKKNIQILEPVQRRAARFVNNDYVLYFFQCYGYDTGLRMAHIRREKMGYRSNHVVQNFK